MEREVRREGGGMERDVRREGRRDGEGCEGRRDGEVGW
jgi:hypothetical protein